MASAPSNHPPNPSGHQKAKSSIFRSFVRRQHSVIDDESSPTPSEGPNHQYFAVNDDIMGVGQFTKNNPGALGELQHNHQESAPRSPRKSRDDHRNDDRGRSRSPTKGTFANIGLPSGGGKGTFRLGKSREASPTKPKKTKSSTNLAGLLSRPKSLKNLYKMATDEEARLSKDKENRTPDESLALAPPPPIFAQFTSDASSRQQRSSVDVARNTSSQEYTGSARPVVKERPWSYQASPSSRPDRKAPSSSAMNRPQAPNPFSPGHHRSKSAAIPTSASASSAEQQKLDPKDIDKHLEAMLDRRNIPENQRYKMRNLNDTIKMEFIRQDWAEMQAAKADRPDSAVASGSDGEEDKPKRTRGKSFTFSRGRSKENTSPTKKSKGEGTLGRHFRSKSTDSVVSNRGEQQRPTSSSGTGSAATSLLAKMKLQQGPADYVSYLRKVQKPELVEVGKLHKLRLLLRNETVAWIEEFIQQGGMKEIVGLLKRIMEVEWREEHEDALLHENLLCLKALSTTARGMQYLHTIQSDLFAKLLGMLFDPERKGPSEFTTRNIITSVLFTYIESATPAERVDRAKSVLAHLRNPQPAEAERPLPFVLEMRQERPYTVWNKEVVSVTKEVFWIFLHNLNVVALPSDKGAPDHTSTEQGPYSYMLRHFPQERPPVAAAPYVGGVEWDATNYIASHLDLMNAILACTPTAHERNALRTAMRISGWDRCLGSSLRLCKEKFYGSVHDGLRRWVAAAAEDGWDVRDVRYGPPAEALSPSKKVGGGQKKKVEAPPRLDMPKLDIGLDRKSAERDAWLS